ncbi:MAG TPA: hypothetical protein ENK28_02780 [Aliiroseovarius sp.]|nr:hypothetical protein [Aliiroseovarius sp.]
MQLPRATRATLASLAFSLAPLPALAGGFACELTFQCQGNMGCSEVSYQPYIDTDWGQIVMKDFGPEIRLTQFPADKDSDAWKLYANLPDDGLLVAVIFDDSSAVFTSYLRQGGAARVVSTYGTCEPRG